MGGMPGGAMGSMPIGAMPGRMPGGSCMGMPGLIMGIPVAYKVTSCELPLVTSYALVTS